MVILHAWRFWMNCTSSDNLRVPPTAVNQEMLYTPRIPSRSWRRHVANFWDMLNGVSHILRAICLPNLNLSSAQKFPTLNYWRSRVLCCSRPAISACDIFSSSIYLLKICQIHHKLTSATYGGVGSPKTINNGIFSVDTLLIAYRLPTRSPRLLKRLNHLDLDTLKGIYASLNTCQLGY